MSISIEDFNANFSIIIGELEKPHIDETGTIPAAVAFNCRCINNNRFQIFEYHFSDQGVVDGLTDQQLIDSAWTFLKSDVQSWATTALTAGSLINSNYVPTSEFSNTYSNLNLTSYNSSFTTRVNRFEGNLHDCCWTVVFDIIKNSNNEKFTVTTSIPVSTFAIIRSDSDILNDAWNLTKNSIGNLVSEKLSSLINTSYTPSGF